MISSKNSQRRAAFERVKAIVLCAAGLTVLLCSGCGYGEISEAAYDHATALYSICNRHDDERLQAYAQLLDEASANGELNERESEWLAEIVTLADAGEWDNAAAHARQMLTDQVGR